MLQYCFCFLFWCFCQKTFGTIAHWPWIETHPALEGEVLTTRPQGKSQQWTIFPHDSFLWSQWPQAGVIRNDLNTHQGFPSGSVSKEFACNAGDPSSIPGWGRPPEEGNSYPLKYSCLENPMDKVAWQVTVHGVAKGQTQLIDLSTHINGHQHSLCASVALSPTPQPWAMLFPGQPWPQPQVWGKTELQAASCEKGPRVLSAVLPEHCMRAHHPG